MINIVVIAASAGGHSPLRHIIAALPIPCAAAIFVVVHIGPNRSILPYILGTDRTPVAFARDGDLIEAGRIYVAPPDRHILMEPFTIRVSHGPKVHHARPAADPLFISAAISHGRRILGVVLSGGGRDGAAGLRAIKDYGGRVLVQDPAEAEIPFMPRSAITATHPEACLPIETIAQRVRTFCSLEEFI